jgi:hypothetical protein
MKKTVMLIMVVMLALSVPAFADVTIGGHGFSDGPYLGARGLGIGIVGGVIAGLSIKNWVSYDNAFQFDVNWDLYQGGVGFGAAYLFHNFEIIQADHNKFPLYIGIKGWGVITNGGSVAAGIMVPLGIAWIPRDVPIDIFLQAEPGISVIPSVRFAPGGGMGIRFWLN